MFATLAPAAESEDGTHPSVTVTEPAELRELNKRNRLLERENEVLRRAAAHLTRVINPNDLVRELAARTRRCVCR